MSTAAPSEPAGSASRAIALLLGATLVLVVVLAAQAFQAERSHRATVQGVLRGYADLAAQRFLRQAKWEVEAFAFYPVVYTLSARERQEPGSPLPDPASIPRLERPIARMPVFLRHLFRFDLMSGRMDSSPETPPDVAAWVSTNLPPLLRQRRDTQGEVATVSPTIGGRPHTLVYGVSPDPERPFALAFDVDLEKLRPYFERAFRDEPLFPAPPGIGLPVSDLLFLESRDAWGRTLFTTRGSFEPALGISRKIADPGLGFFDGTRIRVSIAESAAPRLLIGGVPRSRLPVLLATLTIAAGLLVAALLLSRRERALAQMQSDFVSGVSHELRTPLAQIRLFAETLLRDRIRSEEERSRSLAIINQESRRLSQLVENVLQFSRGQRKTIALALTPTRLDDLVRETVDSFQPLAQARDNRVAVDLVPSTATVDVDAVRQVLLNLLDNAVRYGPAGQEIRVGLAVEDGAAVFSVEDQGPGVPPDKRSEIWKKFVRLERDRGSHRAGTGIGLAVVRDLVVLHGGLAWVEQGARGGAKFVVRLPCREMPP